MLILWKLAQASVENESAETRTSGWPESLLPNSLELRLWYRSLGALDRATLLFPLRVTSSQYAISGWSRRERKALQAIAPRPEKVHGRPGRLPPIPGSLETLLT
jgi:hypothetical protein